MVSVPDLMNGPLFPSDVIGRAKELLSDMSGHSPGSSTGEKGLQLVRRQVKDFISKRDGVPANFEDIYLTEGVTGGVEVFLTLLFFLIIHETQLDFINFNFLRSHLNWLKKNATNLPLG